MANEQSWLIGGGHSVTDIGIHVVQLPPILERLFEWERGARRHFLVARLGCSRRLAALAAPGPKVASLWLTRSLGSRSSAGAWHGGGGDQFTIYLDPNYAGI